MHFRKQTGIAVEPSHRVGLWGTGATQKLLNTFLKVNLKSSAFHSHIFPAPEHTSFCMLHDELSDSWLLPPYLALHCMYPLEDLTKLLPNFSTWPPLLCHPKQTKVVSVHCQGTEACTDLSWLQSPVMPWGRRDCQHSCPCVLRQMSCWANSETKWKHIFWNALRARTRTVNRPGRKKKENKIYKVLLEVFLGLLGSTLTLVMFWQSD